MALSLPECEAAVAEIKQTFTGGWIQKIHQPSSLTVTLDLRVPGEGGTVLICVDPPVARLHLTAGKLENPPSPPPFCQLLRAHLEGGKLEAFDQEPGDRIVYLRITGGGRWFTLAVALTGNSSNVYLLNEAGEIIQTLRPSHWTPGQRYLPPAHSHAPTPSPPHSNALAATERGSIKSAEQPGTPPVGSFAERFPISASLEENYRRLEQERQTAQIIRTRQAQLTRAIKQAQKKVRALQQELEKAKRYREYGRYGELLKAELNKITKGQRSVTVIDYFDPSLPEITLPLDPTKDAVWNMEQYFRQYQKSLSADRHLRPRLELAQREVANLQRELANFDQASLPRQPSLTPVSPLSSPVTPKKSPPVSPNTRLLGAAKAPGARMFLSHDDLPIYVGKTAKDNDALTLKFAKPDDLWLHARGTPGSHVVIRLEKGKPVPPETLRDAATLALWFSDLRKSGKGEVIYTPRKFVKKTKGQRPGAVTVSREKSLWLEIGKDRLERLKSRTSHK